MKHFSFLIFILSLSACSSKSVSGSGPSDVPGAADLPPECSIGAPTDLTAGPGTNVGDSTGYTTITSCGNVTGNVVLGADLSNSGGNCLVVQADGITIDGAGHTITTPDYAVWVQGFSNVIIRNINSDSGIYLYGNDTNGCTIENSTLSGIYVREGDDHNILNNKLTFFATLVDVGSSPPLRLTFKGNLVEGTGTDPVAFYGARNPPCPDTFFTIEENIFQNDSGPSDVPNVMRMGCSHKNTVRKNIMRGTDYAVGWYLRDDISDTLFEQNTLWTNHGEALRIASGNVDKPAPSRNIFRNNIFRSDATHSSYIQITPIETSFEKNLFIGDSAWLTGGDGNTYDRNTFVSSSSPVAHLTYKDTPTDTFISNIFDGPGPDIFDFDGFGFDRYTGDHNVFYQTSGAVNFAGTGSLSNWQAASVAAGHTADANSIEQDPMFMDTTGLDFRLNASSTIVGKGKEGVDPGAYAANCTP